MNEWAVGFLVDDARERVVLIRKNRPAWQEGKLNGVGGKVEPGETAYRAMAREFVEETGYDGPLAWERYVSLDWSDGVVHFFRAFAPLSVLGECATVTDESIEVHRTRRPRPSRPRTRERDPEPALADPCHDADDYATIRVVETRSHQRDGNPDYDRRMAEQAAAWATESVSEPF